MFWEPCRNLPPGVRDVQPDVVTQDGLEIKICVRTYRLFFVSKTEDFLWKISGWEETSKASKRLKERNILRQKWLENSRRGLWLCMVFYHKFSQQGFFHPIHIWASRKSIMVYQKRYRVGHIKSCPNLSSTESVMDHSSMSGRKFPPHWPVNPSLLLARRSCYCVPRLFEYSGST